MEITDSITPSLGAISTKSVFKAEPQYKTIWKRKLLQNTVAHLFKQHSTPRNNFTGAPDSVLGFFCCCLFVYFN